MSFEELGKLKSQLVNLLVKAEFFFCDVTQCSLIQSYKPFGGTPPPPKTAILICTVVKTANLEKIIRCESYM
jgi:hypothetical protein